MSEHKARGGRLSDGATIRHRHLERWRQLARPFFELRPLTDAAAFIGRARFAKAGRLVLSRVTFLPQRMEHEPRRLWNGLRPLLPALRALPRRRPWSRHLGAGDPDRYRLHAPRRHVAALPDDDVAGRGGGGAHPTRRGGSTPRCTGLLSVAVEIAYGRALTTSLGALLNAMDTAHPVMLPTSASRSASSSGATCWASRRPRRARDAGALAAAARLHPAPFQRPRPDHRAALPGPRPVAGDALPDLCRRRWCSALHHGAAARRGVAELVRSTAQRGQVRRIASAGASTTPRASTTASGSGLASRRRTAWVKSITRAASRRRRWPDRRPTRSSTGCACADQTALDGVPMLRRSHED